MGFSRAIVAGTALGGVAAVGIYVAVAAPASTPAKPTSLSAADSAERAAALSPLPVPVFTRTVTAPCPEPSVLEYGVCVTHVAGPSAIIDPGAPESALTGATGSGSAASTRSSAVGTAVTRGTITDDGERAAEGHEDGDEDHGGEDDRDLG